MEPPRGIDLAYLFYNLKTLNLNTLDKSTAIPSLSRDDAYAADILIAPSNEQKRIVEKLELLLSELDKATQALQAAQEKLKNYRRAVLKAAVEGELSRAWREENREGLEPAERLLERILTERRKKWEEDELAKMRAKGKEPKDDEWKEKYKEPEGVDVDGLPELPEGWVWASPEQLASSTAYSLAIGPFGSNLKVSDYKEEGVPLVFVRNIRSEQFANLDDKFISAEKATELKAHQIIGGDVLITKMGDPPGDACVYPKNSPRAVITADCIKWSLNHSLPSKTLFAYLIQSDVVHRQILERTRGVAQLKISLARFKDVAIPLPPLLEQTFIVEQIDSFHSVIGSLSNEIQTQLNRSVQLRQSLLKKAFSGLLVPQDPNDEPASVLLERIRAEREAATAGGKGKRGEAKGSTAAEQPKLFGG